tara:strand:- start:44097 stop:44549 length:453 start_codon:yes stop_codon:yes gene_type:complete
MYETLKLPTQSTPQQSSVNSKNNQPVNVTISPEAMKEFEKLAVYPGWAGNYLPQVNVLNNPDSHKVGYAAWESEFRSQHSDELAEYGNKFKSYYEETKAELKITSAEDYYEKVINNEEKNTSFQQSFEQKLANDPRMLVLMSTLNIKHDF